ncbi:hypothetical protein scyTo_0021721 [Scyliorhinus torazame]|uniref:Uncharacterized protein n=1 Tax=Scyliorhinus torazame TaxID=75743 RepID=A0A401QBG5_SCYTO|nr:hypothetical protein [Scyliorhinus torazame]
MHGARRPRLRRKPSSGRSKALGVTYIGGKEDGGIGSAWFEGSFLQYHGDQTSEQTGDEFQHPAVFHFCINASQYSLPLTEHTK